MRSADPEPWGWRPIAIPIVASVAVIVAGTAVASQIHPATYDGKVVFAVVGNVVVEGLIAVAVWFAGRRIAARNGGWGRAFGWRRPKWIDLVWAAGGLIAATVMRVIVAAVANGASHGHAAAESQNLRVHTVSFAVVAILVFVTVLCAPLVEEIIFRGLLLRAFTRTMGFWPAAALSTVTGCASARRGSADQATGQASGAPFRARLENGAIAVAPRPFRR